MHAGCGRNGAPVWSRVAVVVAAVVALGFAAGGQAHFVFTSDQHYGVTRPHFRGQTDVPADRVNAAMVDAINALAGAVFPADNGVMACQPVPATEFVISGGDIANRMEGTDPAVVITAQRCWEQFQSQYLDGITLTAASGDRAEVVVVPGNHDASNAIGFFRTMTPATDPGAMLAMYRRAHGDLAAEEFDHAQHKVFLSRDWCGIRLFLFQMWPCRETRERLEREIALLPAGTPVILVTHMQPDIDANRLTNPNGQNDINPNDKFENLVSDIASVATVRGRGTPVAGPGV
ncbi:MAG: metallophosphoesterase, partial [Planctomycetes bacterium]|nr:metallophosphoesterase [Planctomycetota bacterium]